MALCICVPVLVNLYVQKVTGNPTQDGLQKKAWMFLRGAVTASLCRRCGRPQPLHIIPSRSWLLTVCHSYQRQTKADKGRKRQTKKDKDKQRHTKTHKDTQRHTNTHKDTQRHTKTDKDSQGQTKTHKDTQRQTNSVLPFLSL